MSELSALRQQIAEAIHHNRFPDSTWDRQPATVQADYLACADAVLAAIQPHGTPLSDQLRDAEAQLTKDLEAIKRVRALCSPDENTSQLGYLRRSQDFLAAIDGPPAHDGPTVRECADADRAYWERKDAGQP